MTTHVYAGGAACITEYDSTTSEGDTEERWFVHGPSFPDPLVMVDLTDMGDVAAGTGEYLYYLKDMLGSVTALANSNGTVVERYVYDPYGKTTVPLTCWNLPQGWEIDLFAARMRADRSFMFRC